MSNLLFLSLNKPRYAQPVPIRKALLSTSRDILLVILH